MTNEADMLWGVFMLLTAGTLWGVLGVVIRHLRERMSAFVACQAISGMIAAVAAWSLFPPVLTSTEITAEAGVASLAGLAVLLFGSELLRLGGLLFVQRGMRSGHSGQIWLLAQSAFVVPYLAGTILFGERVGLAGSLGMAACIGSVLLLSTAGRSSTVEADGLPGPRRDIFALLAFACFGVQQTLVTIPSHLAMPAEVMQMRAPLSLTWSALISLLILLRTGGWPKRDIALPALGLAASAVVSMILLFRGLDRLAEAQMVSLSYGITVGACIVSYSLYSRLCLKESFSVRQILGLGGILLGLICIAIAR